MTTFVTCGNHQDHPAGAVVKHTVAEVRLCWAQRYDREHWEAYTEAEAQAEAEMERRTEQYYENRGADDGFDEWEARRGVVDFSTAWDLADPSRLTYRDYLDKEAGRI